MEIFYQNYYKKYQERNVTTEVLAQILNYNCITQQRMNDDETCTFKSSLFCLKSFINHSVHENLNITYVLPNLIFVFALKDIKKGEELLIDYCSGVDLDD